MKKTVYIVVELYGGVVDDVKLFFEEKEAEDEFEKYTGISYSEFEDSDYENDGSKEESHILVKEIEF